MSPAAAASIWGSVAGNADMVVDGGLSWSDKCHGVLQRHTTSIILGRLMGVQNE
eukprot:m.1652004 g.1652004  ORF g.1652004 m.1652004 type:complete len:54 (-) comp91925_c0_seq1:355-516(-)